MRQPITLRREMAITHADFFRTLRRLIPAERLVVEQHTAASGTAPSDPSVTATAHIDEPPGTITISLARETTRRLGSLALPSVHVEFRFDDMAQAEVDGFLERFDTHFRRGGG